MILIGSLLGVLVVVVLVFLGLHTPADTDPYPQPSIIPPSQTPEPPAPADPEPVPESTTWKEYVLSRVDKPWVKTSFPEYKFKCGCGVYHPSPDTIQKWVDRVFRGPCPCGRDLRGAERVMVQEMSRGELTLYMVQDPVLEVAWDLLDDTQFPEPRHRLYSVRTLTGFLREQGVPYREESYFRIYKVQLGYERIETPAPLDWNFQPVVIYPTKEKE